MSMEKPRLFIGVFGEDEAHPDRDYVSGMQRKKANGPLKN